MVLSDELKKQNNSAYIFHKMLDAVPISMLLVNLKGEIVFANRFTEQLFGYDQQELMGKAIETLIPERFREKHPAYRTAYMKLPKIRSMGLGRDLFGLRVDGSEVPVEIGLTPVRIEAGFFVLASIVDISEREYVKEKLTAEEIKKAQLEIINDQLAEFSHTVSHDLTNPFLKIETFLPKILPDKLEGEAADAANIIKASVNEGKSLVKYLLDYAQASSLQIDDVDLNAIARELVATYDNKEIKFTVGQLPTIKGDAVLVRQLFSNLFSNAVKYQRQDCIDKQVEVGIHDKDFFVKDNGIGITSEHLAKVGTPFYRIHPKTKYMGSGLGLSICKKIVEKHGGKLLIESKVDEGTTVFFTLGSQ